MLNIRINLRNRFQIKLKILIFWNNFAIKGISSLKQAKRAPSLNSAYSNYLRHHLWFSRPNLFKRVLSVKNNKSKHHHWILHIRISLSTEFHFKLAISNIRTQFPKKWYFWSKMEKGCIAIEFCIFELVLMANFSLNWQF